MNKKILIIILVTVVFIFSLFYLKNYISIYFNNKGCEESKKNNYDEALRLFDEFEKFNNKMSITYFNKGKVYEYLGRCEEAENEYEIAMAMSPGKTMYFQQLANLYIKLFDNDMALELCNKMLEITEDKLPVYEIRANTLFNMGEYKNVIKDCNAIISIRRDSFLVYMNYEVCLIFP